MTYPETQTAAVINATRCSDALRALFGEFAEEVARLDPFPHTNALNLPAPILHLLLLALSRNNREAAELCLMQRGGMREAIMCIFRGPIPQARAVLRRLPLVSLEKNGYRRLYRLMHCEHGRSVLAHAEAIAELDLEILDYVPAPLRRPCIMRDIRTVSAAKLVQFVVHRMMATRTGGDQVKAFSDQLNATRSPATFWACVETHLLEQLPSFAPPLNFGDHRFRAITTPRSLLLTARCFENCLADYLGEAMTGEIGFYVWSNGVHKAVIAIRPLVGCPGLIHEIQGPRNGDLPSGVMDQILEPMLRAGFVKAHEVRRRTLVLRKLRNSFRGGAAPEINNDSYGANEDIESLIKYLGV